MEDQEAIASLASSSTKRRLAALTSLEHRIAKGDLPSELLDSLVIYVFRTYPYYLDRRSRTAVESLLSSPQLYPPNTSRLLELYCAECAKRGLAAGNALVLLKWGYYILHEVIPTTEQFKSRGLVIIIATAQVLETCLAAKDGDVRRSIRREALQATRVLIREIERRQPKEGLRLTIQRLTSKDSPLGQRAAPFLGILADEEKRRTGLPSSCVDQILQFYTREIIGSKTPVPSHIASGLGPFVQGFLDEDLLRSKIVPTLEKSLLRAPEVVLQSVVVPLVNNLPPDLDTTAIVQENLLRPLLSNVKSQHENIREGAVNAYQLLAKRSLDRDILPRLLQTLLDAFSQAKVATERQSIAQMLGATSMADSMANTICQAVCKAAVKETNEAALRIELVALYKYASAISKSSSTEKLIIDSVKKGAIDKKAGIRKLWMLQSGDYLYRCLHDNPNNGLDGPLLPTAFDVVRAGYEEVLQNPLAAGQNGLAAVGYLMAPITKKLANGRQASSKNASNFPVTNVPTTALQSFFLNHRVYSKLESPDLARLGDALASVGRDLADLPVDVQIAWAEAFVFLICSSVPANIRRNAARYLEALCIDQRTSVGTAVIQALWKWHYDRTCERKDTPATSGKNDDRHLLLVLRCITAISEGSLAANGVIHDLLMGLLVLCRPEIIPGANWVNTCLRMRVDPGLLVRSNVGHCFEAIHMRLQSNSASKDTSVSEAGYNTAAEVAFVSPNSFVPMLERRILGSLSADELTHVGPTEIAIARTPEGTAFLDVLNTQAPKNSVNKNSPDYEIAKWEEEMRNKLAQKNAQVKKLTPDEKAKVATQLEKEARIRRDVNRITSIIEEGAGFIRALAHGPPTDPRLWLSSSLSALLVIIQAGAGRLVGQAADDAYLACADLVSPRIGFQRLFIGIATLRANGSSVLPTEVTEEPLSNLVTRILHRIHFLSSQRPLDVISLTYILPLLFAVLERGGVGQCDEEAVTEQITLALEIIEYHTDDFSDASILRKDALELLISCMQRLAQHYKLIKDCLLGITGAMAGSIKDEEVKALLQGAIAPEQNVRTAALQAIRDHIDLTELDFSVEIWLAHHDDVEENITLGKTIWEENALDVEPANATEILPFIESDDKSTRNSASRALAKCIGADRSRLTETLHHLQERYVVLAKPKLPEKDEFGMPKKMDLSDAWAARHGIALAFKELASEFDPSGLPDFIDFLISKEAVGDRNPIVRDTMVQSATRTIELHGALHLSALMSRIESSLGASQKTSAESDSVSEAVVILYGSLACHLPNGDPKVPEVVYKLLATLATPSETVQYAVANCLPPLIRTSDQRVSDYIQDTLGSIRENKKYAARRGAGYGLAGIIKGAGIAAFKEFRVMSSLKGAIEAKKDQNQRQGALFAYELLALLLGQTFEPYIIQIVPQLLGTFGDASADVRDACSDTSKTCFSHLSSYGVKVILPTLLEGLEESQWRSKRGACDLLGAMAYLDPQQLALSLPDIIPPLTNVLNDSHKEVRAAANRSLQQFGEVISNPEVKSLVGVLLKALSDPTKFTEPALEALIKVSFIHYLDSPSLALIVRILQRGLSDRSGTKKKAAQIIGNLAHLTERKDLTSHLPILVAGLRGAIVDPVPGTRATASKALGSLVEKLGEDALPDLIPNLMMTLKSDTGAGDRLGSAQALSEVIAGLGTSRLEETLPTILHNAASVKATVREGFMSLFIYLPACFGNSFSNYLSRVIPPILSGLADEIESIRETALRAGRLLVKNFATRSIDLLLPELDRGLADNNYRIRLSSVELVGDLLFNLTGISGNTEEDEGDEDAGNEAGQSLLEVLGEEKRNKILSSLYVCRCDTSGLVRNAAISVWKALVSTPRTLKELVPTLTQLIIRRLASSNMEQKVIAGNALGELIRKAGEGVLAVLLPTLEEGLRTSTDADHRQGICIALREVTAAASHETLADYEKTLIGVVRVALVDHDSDVREAAAEAFDSLQQVLGKKAVDQVLPYLLNLLRSDDDADTALSALLTLLTDNTRSNIILPNLIPTLLVSPMSAFNARAIASLSKVAGPPMNRRLPNVLNTMMDNIISCKDDTLRTVLEESFDTILVFVDEFDGLNTLMSVMLALTKNADHHKRSNSNMRLNHFISYSEVDFSRYYPDLIRVLLISFDDSDHEVVKSAWTALSGLMQRMKKEEMESLVSSSRQTLQQVGVAGANLPGFQLPKGIMGILPVFLQGLMNGTADQRTTAALAISDIIDRTSADALKPFVTQITGPLIRVVSERSTDVKAAILLTLNNLLEKISIFLKPFLPQLQRTFAKCLADPSSEILRARAAKALGTLITLTPRVDPLIAELVTGSKTSDPGVQAAMMKALFEVVSKAGQHMSPASRTSILSLLDAANSGDLPSDSDATLALHARLFGALIASSSADPSTPQLLKTRALSTHPTLSQLLNLNAVLLSAPSTLTTSLASETSSTILAAIPSTNPSLSSSAVLAAGKLLLSTSPPSTLPSLAPPIISALTSAILPSNPSSDTRRLGLIVIRTLSRIHHSLLAPQKLELAPAIFASVRDPVIPVKLAAEAAFIALFRTADVESQDFDDFMAEHGDALSGAQGQKLPSTLLSPAVQTPGLKRSMGDYFKRVGLRLGSQVRERREAEGKGEGEAMEEEEEDEREVWSVGRLEAGDKTFALD